MECDMPVFSVFFCLLAKRKRQALAWQNLSVCPHPFLFLQYPLEESRSLLDLYSIALHGKVGKFAVEQLYAFLTIPLWRLLTYRALLNQVERGSLLYAVALHHCAAFVFRDFKEASRLQWEAMEVRKALSYTTKITVRTQPLAFVFSAQSRLRLALALPPRDRETSMPCSTNNTCCVAS
jgi:hypothetical protein